MPQNNHQSFDTALLREILDLFAWVDEDPTSRAISQGEIAP